jgi:chromosome segregation protein
MSADQPRTRVEGNHGAHDIVGSRVLVGTQMVDISRLSTHPVPLISQGLITVAGQGPKDSNGAGKSSFIAGLSLLHADDQWKLASGAAGAAELLFTAELAAQETRYSNADHGYIIGVFAAPGATTVAELQESTLTVWLRINRKAPYLDLRWHDGLFLPYGTSEAQRVARVDEMWQSLPLSNGRTDFHASRLSTVLFGGNARCVSFLSTSVRSSPTPNLLAQPLNDLSAARIFDAIANLTGLDRELEQEQALRSKEHMHRVQVLDAERDLETWQREIAIVEAGISQRRGARDQLGTSRAAWQSRCARHLVDGLERADQIRAALIDLDVRAEQLSEQLRTVNAEIDALSDDGEFSRRLAEAKERWAKLTNRDKNLDTDHQVAARQLDELSSKHRQLLDLARAADGRTQEVAAQELETAKDELERALTTKGAAEAAEQQARMLRDAAESGQDLATAQLGVLEQAGVPAAALLDVVHLEAAERPEWEPRLALYRDAVVVHRDQGTRARGLLADLSGSTLILADQPVPAAASCGDLPASADPRFDLAAFLAAIGRRAEGAAAMTDAEAGVIVLGGFTDPLTGRPARIAAARQDHAEKAELLNEAVGRLNAVRKVLSRAEERAHAADAAEQASRIHVDISRLRKEDAARLDQRETLRPLLATAEDEYAGALGVSRARDEKLANLRATRSRLHGSQHAVETEKMALTGERDGMDLLGRQADWGESNESARRHLLSLGDIQQQRTTTEWNEEACHALNDAVRLCFPEGTPAEEMPAEIRELLVEQRWQRGGLDVRVGLTPALLRALRTHLNLTEQHDKYQQTQINTQRAERNADLTTARLGLAEAEQTSRAHRASLALGIKAALRQVAQAFDELDQAYGGYGAGLDYPEPEPPAEPDRPWQWTVVPKWRRAEGQRMGSYNLKANTAQIDEKAAKLVCAAALAAGSDRPLMLILDELGRNLGKQHRREAVALFERIGRDRNITVVGALQDDMERYAIEASGLYIKLRRSSDAIAYNEPPVIVGDEAKGGRVELLAEWLSSYRPAVKLENTDLEQSSDPEDQLMDFG